MLWYVRDSSYTETPITNLRPIRINTASLEYKGDNWLDYNRQFHFTAAATQNTTWGYVDQRLWNLAFSTKANTTCCQYYFSINHKAAEYGWAPEHLMSIQPVPLFPQRCPLPVCFK